MTTIGIEPFDYSPEECEAFTEGDCWELARQIHLLAGYPIVTVNSPETTSTWYHAANRLPDGRVLDIEGIWEEDVWLAEWALRHGMDNLHWLVSREWNIKAFMDDIQSKGIGIWFDISFRAKAYAEEIIRASTPLNAETLLL